MNRIIIALLFSFASSLTNSATTPSVYASVDCRIVMIQSERCGTTSTTIPGKEIETSLAVHETYTNPQFPYGEMGQNSLAVSQARSSYGNLGVYTLGNTVAYANGIGGGVSAYAESIAKYQDVIQIPSGSLPLGTAVDVTLGISINRDLTTRSLSTSGYFGTSALLDARLNITLLDGNLLPVQSLLSFQAVACSPIPCSTTGTTIESAGIDNFAWSFKLRSGDYLALQSILRAESDGVFSTVVLGNHNGVGTAIVQSYNSAHTFIRVEGSDSPLTSLGGASYLTSPVPAPPTLALALVGLLFLAGRRSYRAPNRIKSDA